MTALAACGEARIESPTLESAAIPELVIEGAGTSPEHAARIRQIDPRRLGVAVELLGLERPGEPILLVLAPEESMAARSTPHWIAGYALSDRSAAVLFPERTPSYPDSTFEELVLHEIGHVLVYRASGGHRAVPRWFNEGLALFIGRPWRLGDRSRVTWALVAGRQVSLADLEPYFHRSRETAGHAYALAGAFVQDLVKREGGDAVAAMLGDVARGRTFDEAFLLATGQPIEDAERDFWRRHTFLYRWIPVFGSSATLWLLVTLLALWAFRRRSARTAALHARWEAEDSLSEGNETTP